MAKYFPSQVIFDTKDQREKVQDYVYQKYGRAFSAHCRHILLKEMREENTQAAKADA